MILSLSPGFMSHGSVMVLLGKKWRMASFLVADGPFFAAGLFFNPFFPDM